ncbi:response regulator transcription factor [Ensifer adhaerens]|uniref:response regulator transcription factor n=1 Tax=Ensifer canadensis TaxID=555315 RepID=UPI001490282A|nr:response regulator [Ensifer canadensis]NOV20288.1 response regulator transcription factor [Ensifer canadensis]
MEHAQTSAGDAADPVVYVVDDDQRVREALLDLFLVTQIRATAFSNGHDFLQVADIRAPGCLILDIKMPGETGLDLQQQLSLSGSRLPVIFLTAHADIPTSVKAMKAGAADFITKPFAGQDLLDAVDRAIRLDSERRKVDAERDRIQSLVDSLTPREQEVMSAVVSGLMNKQVAYQLGISEMTVKLHRMSLMRKMQSRSLADLVRKVEQLRSC